MYSRAVCATSSLVSATSIRFRPNTYTTTTTRKKKNGIDIYRIIFLYSYTRIYIDHIRHCCADEN